MRVCEIAASCDWRDSLTKTPAVLALAAVLLVVLVVATGWVWTILEEGAYRSPLQSETQEFTPYLQGLEDRAAAEAERAMDEGREQPATPGGAAVAGAELFQANGCYACHSLEGERKIGPSLRGIFGTTVELNDGSTVPIDDTYLVESILQPEAKRVAGYDDAAMPSYEGLVSVEDVWALAEYIKGLE
jgi:cytochrome c oxidase subunit 2